MASGWFVDLHSHVVPSGDDGAQSMGEGVALCEAAAHHGTRTLFATPHVASHLPPDEERETLVAERVEELRARSGIDLRLGWELTPIAALLEEDPRRYALEGLDLVLMEVPGWQLLRGGLASLVASDGHRATRPARLDDAWELARAELGTAARRLFDGSALGLAQPLEQRDR